MPAPKDPRLEAPTPFRFMVGHTTRARRLVKVLKMRSIQEVLRQATEIGLAELEARAKRGAA